jgi:hypothetical protein
MRFRFAVPLFACLLPAFAADIRGPVLGYVLDGSQLRLRPILGIPGAASTGAVIDNGVDIYAAAFSPSANYVLALTGTALAPFSIVPGQAAVPVPGALSGADQILLSPEGSAAALYFRASRSVQILTGLPAAPSVARTLDLSSLPSAPAALALSDDDGVLAAVVNGDTSALYLFAADSSVTLVALQEAVTAIDFLHRRHDAILTGASDAFLIQDVLGAAGVVALAGDGISSPSAVTMAGDNSHAFALNSNSGVVVALDLSGGASVASDCQCAATGLARLNGAAAFRLTEYSTGPMLIVDGAALSQAPPGPPRVLFVPPAQTAEN